MSVGRTSFINILQCFQVHQGLAKHIVVFLGFNPNSFVSVNEVVFSLSLFPSYEGFLVKNFAQGFHCAGCGGGAAATSGAGAGAGGAAGCSGVAGGGFGCAISGCWF